MTSARPDASVRSLRTTDPTRVQQAPPVLFTIDRINREVPALKNIWIYRSPFGLMQSWNRRERIVREDAGGQVGLLELLCCMDVRLNKDIFILPYEHD
jgi:hypothetical protein